MRNVIHSEYSVFIRRLQLEVFYNIKYLILTPYYLPQDYFHQPVRRSLFEPFLLMFVVFLNIKRLH
jgi:hypothetical protein